MSITEIAPDVFRLSLFIPEANLQFNQFLVRDDEPLLFHTGMRAIFPMVRDAVAQLIDPATLRHISFSHFEADECGSLNDWLEIAPNAQAACSFVGAEVSINDFASRPARSLEDGETFSTGKYSFRFIHTPHLPHCWEAGRSSAPISFISSARSKLRQAPASSIECEILFSSTMAARSPVTCRTRDRPNAI